MKIVFSLVLLIAASALAVAQTVYVPSGTSGIGATTSGNTNVGVGTTNAPAEKLTVKGNVRIEGQSGFNHSEVSFYRADGARFASIGQGILTSANSTFDFTHYNANDFRFMQSTNERVRITAAGNVGISTSTPARKLSIEGTGEWQIGLKDKGTGGQEWRIGSSGGDWAAGAGKFLISNNDGSTSASLVIDTQRKVGIGTVSPQAFLDVGAFIPNGTMGTVFGRLSEGNATGGGTYLGVRGFATQQDEYGGKGFSLEHGFYGTVNNSINFYRGGGITGGFMTFNTDNNVERMRILGDGNVAIGTADPKGYKLAVAGKVIAEEIVVKLQGNWPDYVFEKRYDLPSLAEVEKYIQQNKHLPEVPAAKEVEANGVNLGEMNILLLKKVEELTLYVIEQNKQIEQLRKDISRNID